MAELTEDRVREIVKKEIAKATKDIVKLVEKDMVDRIRERVGKYI